MEMVNVCLFDHPDNVQGIAPINFKEHSMQELTNDEMSSANGGVLPVVGFALALTSKGAGSTGVATWALSSVTLVLASFELGRYLGSFSRD